MKPILIFGLLFFSFFIFNGYTASAAEITPGTGFVIYGDGTKVSSGTITTPNDCCATIGNLSSISVGTLSPAWTIIKTSPIKKEALVGTLNTNINKFEMLRWGGTNGTWALEWTENKVASAGLGATVYDGKAFAMAYENSGEAVVAWAATKGTTGGNQYNRIEYKVWNPTTGWTASSSFHLTQVTASISWMEAYPHPASGSDQNEITICYQTGAKPFTSSGFVGCVVWDGDTNTFGNEKRITGNTEEATKPGDIKAFDGFYEQGSGKFISIASLHGTLLASTSWNGSAWGSSRSFAALDPPLNVSCSAMPYISGVANNQGICEWYDTAALDSDEAEWDGAGNDGLGTATNLDISAYSTSLAGGDRLATGWLINGTTRIGLSFYAEAAAGAINEGMWDEGAGSYSESVTGTPVTAQIQQNYRFYQSPANKNKAIMLLLDQTGDLQVYKASISSGTTIGWGTIKLDLTQDMGAAAGSTASMSADFAYFNYASPSQTHFRWYNDDDAPGSATALASEDIPASGSAGLVVDNTYRLRFEISNEGPATASNNRFILQFARENDAAGTGCNTLSPGWSWITASASSTGGAFASRAFDLEGSSYFSDGDSISSTLLTASDPNPQNGYAMSNTATTGYLTLNGNDYTEIEYNLKPNTNANTNATYCFRLARNSGSSMASVSFDKYASASVRPILKDESAYRWYDNLNSTKTFGTAFDGDGAVVSTNGAQARSIKADGDYIYIAGWNDSNGWRIEKRNKVTGKLCSSVANCSAGIFDRDGIITNSSANKAYAIAIDESYLYIAGDENGSSDWHVEKRNKNTGALCDSTVHCVDGVFNTDGIISATNLIANDITVDGLYMYVTGTPDSGNWKTSKYNKTTGELCTDTSACADGLFGVSGSKTSSGTVPYSVVVDDYYVYVAGSGGADWRIEKMNKSTGNLCSSTANCVDGAFDTDGILTVTGGALPNSLTVDDYYVYVVGYDDSSDWRIDKYNKSTGAICDGTVNCVDGAFDTDGTLSVAGTGNNYARSIFVDNDYIYIGGDDNSNNDWRIEKRNKTTGALCVDTATCVVGAFDGDGIISAPETGNGSVYSVFVDADYVYIAGDENAHADWRIEKRNNETGALCDGTTNCLDRYQFDSDGIITVEVGTGDEANSVVVDGDYVYITGTTGASGADGRIEKRNKNTGALCSSTVNCAAGAFDTDGFDEETAPIHYYDIVVDDDYLYITGDGAAGWYIEKRNKVTGAFCDGTVNCAAGAFDTDGILTVAYGNFAHALAVDADYIYIAGSNSTPNWRIEKRNKNTGAICDGTANCLAGVFGTAGVISDATGDNMYDITVDGDYVYVAGNENVTDWRMAKYNKTTGVLCSSTATCAVGAFNTDGIISSTDPGGIAQSITVDDEYVYVAGTDSSAGRIEKYNNKTGNICSSTVNCAEGAFDTDGILAGQGLTYSVALKSDFIYISGVEGLGGAINKYNKDTGDICANSVDCSDGVFGAAGIVALTSSTNTLYSIDLDDDSIYTVGDVDTGDWRIEKRNNKTGALADTSALTGANIGAPLAALSTPYSLTTTGQQFRLRLLVYANTGSIASGSGVFKIQYAGKGAGTCAAPSGTPSTYTDISTSTEISFYDNSNLTDNMRLVGSSSIDPTDGTNFINNQSYEEANNFSNLYSAISNGEDGIWDFAFYDNGATAGATYCVRAVDSTGATFNSYVYPEVTMAEVAGPPVPDTSRSGGGHGPSSGGTSGGGTPQGGGNQGGGGGENCGVGDCSGGGGGQSGGGSGGGGGASPIMFMWWWLKTLKVMY